MNLYFIQLVLNALWPYLFFLREEVGQALILNFVLTVVVIYMLFCFYKLRPFAGIILIPYVLWLFLWCSSEWQYLYFKLLLINYG